MTTILHTLSSLPPGGGERRLKIHLNSHGHCTLKSCSEPHPIPPTNIKTIDHRLNAYSQGRRPANSKPHFLRQDNHAAAFSACAELSSGLFQVRKWPSRTTVVSK